MHLPIHAMLSLLYNKVMSDYLFLVLIIAYVRNGIIVNRPSCFASLCFVSSRLFIQQIVMLFASLPIECITQAEKSADEPQDDK